MHQLYLIFEKKMGKKCWALRRCKHISRGHLLQEFFKISDGILVCCNRGDTLQYHGGLQSKELCQAPMLLVFLTPRQVLSSHPLKQIIWLYWLQDRDRIPNWCTINHPTTLHMQWNPLLLADVTLRCRMYPTGWHLAIPAVYWKQANGSRLLEADNWMWLTFVLFWNLNVLAIILCHNYNIQPILNFTLIQESCISR